MTAVSPATLQILPNAHYANQEDYTWALADAVRVEYRARSTIQRLQVCTTGGFR
jgi:hypothetical protein